VREHLLDFDGRAKLAAYRAAFRANLQGASQLPLPGRPRDAGSKCGPPVTQSKVPFLQTFADPTSRPAVMTGKGNSDTDQAFREHETASGVLLSKARVSTDFFFCGNGVVCDRSE
jgi:hypothetical protein